jgi:cleavage stimulation factor subunit 1
MSTAALDALQGVTGGAVSGNRTTGALSTSDKPQQGGLVIDPTKLDFYTALVHQLREDGLVDEAKQLQARLPSASGSGAQTKRTLFEIYQKEVELQRTRPKTQDATEWTLLRPRPLPPIGPNEDHLDLRKYRSVPTLDNEEDEENPEENGEETEDIIDRLGAVQRKPVPQFKTRYTAQHKQGVRSAAFSCDGRLCASGSSDTSIKVMDTSKMRMFGLISGAARTGLRALGAGGAQGGGPADELRPVIRTFYDHVGTVNCLAFHPRQPVLFSGSADKTIKIFDLTRGGVNKKAMVSISDVAPVNVVSPHPSGDFVLVGTQNPTIRLYDVNTQQCFSSYYQQSWHKGAISDIKYSSDASVYASCSGDGNILLWDGVSSKPVNKLVGAHNTQSVFNCQWSRNNRYLLTTGGDNRVRLWDIRTGKELLVYCPDANVSTCAGLLASFLSGEEYIATASVEGGQVALIDTLTGSVVIPNMDLHQGPARCLATCPTDPTFISGGDDFKVRYVELNVGEGGIDAEGAAGGEMMDFDE